MRTLFTTVILAVAFGASALVYAQSEAAMQECFKNHGQMMDKPSVKNPRDCWRTHAHLGQAS